MPVRTYSVCCFYKNNFIYKIIYIVVLKERNQRPSEERRTSKTGILGGPLAVQGDSLEPVIYVPSG